MKAEDGDYEKLIDSFEKEIPKILKKITLKIQKWPNGKRGTNVY